MPREPLTLPLPLRLTSLTLLVGASIAVPASQSTSRILVSATVPPRVDLVLQVPATLTLTAQDVQRRELVLAEAVRIDVSGNTPHGVALDLQAPDGLFDSIRVRGERVDALLPGAGGTLAYRWQDDDHRSAHLALQFTFRLETDVAPGIYPWPVLIRVDPLNTARSAQ